MRISDWSSDVCSSDLVRAGIGNWGLGIGTSGFAHALRFHESLIPNAQSRLLREHLAQEPEQLAERMRRLVALALVERVAHQLAQLLAVGRRVRFDQLRERGVAFLEQALAPAFGAVQQRGFLARGLAAGVE